MRWTDLEASREALRRATLLSARQGRGLFTTMHRLKAQTAAIDTCIEDGTKPPCPGPFVHPRGRDVNTELEDDDGETKGVFGNPLIIFGVLVLFMVMVRQSRMNKRRASRWR